MDKLSVKEYKNPFEEKGIREENRSRSENHAVLNRPCQVDR